MTDPRIHEALAAARTLHASGHTKEARREERRAEKLIQESQRQRFIEKRTDSETVWLGLDVTL